MVLCSYPSHNGTSGAVTRFWARLEDTSGKHYEPGDGGSCLGFDRTSIGERMRKDAVLLKPGQSIRGSFTFDPRVFHDLNAGTYRLEAVLYGWNLEFTKSELTLSDHPKPANGYHLKTGQ
jgi:hypothetical protein